MAAIVGRETDKLLAWYTEYMEGKDVKGAMVGGGQEKLSEYASFPSNLNTQLTEYSALHQSSNHRAKRAMVGGRQEQHSRYASFLSGPGTWLTGNSSHHQPSKHQARVAMVGGDREQLSEYASFLSGHEPWLTGNSAQHQKRAIKYGPAQDHITDPK